MGEPLGFNNSFALVVRAKDAERLRPRRLPDLPAHAASPRVGLANGTLTDAGAVNVI